MYEHSSKESNSATDNNMSGTSESGSTSNDDDFDEFLSFLSPPPQTRTPTETEREIVIEEEKDEDGTHQTSISNIIPASASATPLNFFPHTVDEGEVLDMDASWSSTSYGPEVKLNNNNTPHDDEIRDTETRTIGYHNNTVAGLLLLHNINRIVIEDIEAGRIPDYHHCQHTETETSSSNPDPFIVEAFQRYDTDGNGELSLDELKELLQSLGLGATMEEDENFLDRWIQKIDKDGNGSIEFEEFLSIFNNMKENSAMDIDKLLLETFQQVRKIFFLHLFMFCTHFLCITHRRTLV